MVLRKPLNILTQTSLNYYYRYNTQPYYVLVDNNGKLLAVPKSYTPDVDEYNKFLEEGLCRYKAR